MSKKTHDGRSASISRRRFLGGVGAAALATSAPLGFFPRVGHAQRGAPRFVIREDRFGRMFPELPPFFERNTSNLRNALIDIGKLGGRMDAKDQLGDGGEQAAIDLIVNPALSANNQNNAVMKAGHTFIGQFIDHDLTFDLNSRLAVVTEPTESPNERDPRFDIDSVYGGGPSRDPELYERRGRERPTKLKIENGGLFEDVPRRSDRSAIIADPRNDENMMISGLQAAFIMFHNHAVDVVKDDNRRLSSEEVFEKARQLTTWHYQWIVLTEILPLFIGEGLTRDILERGRRFYRPRTPFIPVEFQGAAYRFGHTLVRPSYRANLNGENASNSPANPFFGMIFVPDGEERNPADPVDLRGGARARRRFIGWQTFFDFGPTFTDGPGNPNPAIRPNKRVDTAISTPLLELPVGTIAGAAPNEPIISLPARNMLRGITWGLPSGQSIARRIGAPVLDGNNDDFLRGLRDYDTQREKLNLDDSTPLWVYCLEEGFRLGTAGNHLGPVGGRIVGEVFIGLLELDHESFLNASRRWRPTLPDRSGRVTGNFKMIDFLTFAGVAPDQRGQ